MDVVSSGSGKLESLEFVRKSRGYGAEVTVACGEVCSRLCISSCRHADDQMLAR